MKRYTLNYTAILKRKWLDWDELAILIMPKEVPGQYPWLTLHNLTKVIPLFMLLHWGSDNSLLLIVFSANNIDQSIVYVTESRLNDFVIFKNNALRLKYAIWLVEIMMLNDFVIFKNAALRLKYADWLKSWRNICKEKSSCIVQIKLCINYNGVTFNVQQIESTLTVT